MPRIFISYRRTDSSTVSGRIYDHLAEVFGDDNVFKDVYDIPAGSDFRQVIEDNINASNIQLIVIGPTWIDVKAADGTRRLDNTEDAVRIEVESGLNCRDILLIPVLVSGAPMPRPEQFPESMRDLSFRNAVTIRDDPDFRTDISNLIRAIKQRESQRAQGQFRRRLPIFATSAVLGIVVLLLIVYAATRQQMPQVSVIISTKTSVVQLASTLAPSLEAPTTTPLPASATALPASATTASGLTPDTPDAAKAVALIREGDALQQQNDYSSALDRYTQALVLDPTNAEAYISRASVYSLLGTNFDQAIQDANQAIQLDPNNYWNYDELGKIYSADEKYDLSVQAYSKALALQSVPSGYLGRGRAYHLLGDIPDALADLTHSIELDPTNLDVYVERAWTNYDAKHYQDAIADFSAVIEQNPQADNSFMGRGEAYRELHDLTSALKDLDQSLALNPDSADAYYQRGYTHQLNEDFSAARDDYQEVLKRDPNDANAYIGLARLNLDTFNDSAAALQYAVQAVNLAEANPYAQAVLGDVYYQQGQKENALAHYRRYIELIGNDADPDTLARIHELEGS